MTPSEIPMLNEELDQLLKNLHLKRVLEILEEELAHAQKKDSTYQEFLPDFGCAVFEGSVQPPPTPTVPPGPGEIACSEGSE